MRKIFNSFVVILCMFVLFASCSNNSPKAVATTWLNSFWHLEYEQAKNVSTEETKNFISALQQFSAVVPDSSKREMKLVGINIKDVAVKDSNAVVTYFMSDMPEKPQTLNLVKKEGKWLVQFTKNDQANNSALAPADINTESPLGTDTTGPAQMLSDSVVTDTSRQIAE